MADSPQSVPDCRLCARCPFPAATVAAARLARRLAQDVQSLALLVMSPDQARKVQAIIQADADQIERLIQDLPTPEYFEGADDP
ncbi:MAG: hypothetical protein GXX96_38090 [Planctomycetaceae bacterium]|nr:hypothetical protein [Planctomycetaceae bacterium]